MEAVVAVAILVGAFYILAIVTEEFFVPAIDIIAAKLKLNGDAAGATLLAAGSSAPEFFTSLFAVLGLAGAHADVGAGTIVGSAIFNVLVIVGAAAMFRAVKLQWQPVIRDQLFYIVTVLLLLWAFWDGSITLFEALVFVATYAIYVATVVHWRKILKYADVQIEVATTNKRRSSVNLLVHRALSLILPDTKLRPRLYLLSFSLSILAIAALSWLLVDRVVVIAEIFHINPTFLALTVLAAGTSMPDLIGSIVVAKQGRGDMAVSNAIGSNVFDILFGLGLPWLLVLSFGGQAAISVSKDNLLASVILLFATVVATLFLLIIRNWRIGHRSGLLLIGLYVAYVLYVLITVL